MPPLLRLLDSLREGEGVMRGSGLTMRGSGLTIGIFPLESRIANCNCGTLTKPDPFRQTFPPSLCELPPSLKLRRTGWRAGNPKLHVAKGLGREIFRPRLALGQIFPIFWGRVRRTATVKRNRILTGLTGLTGLTAWTG